MRFSPSVALQYIQHHIDQSFPRGRTTGLVAVFGAALFHVTRSIVMLQQMACLLQRYSVCIGILTVSLQQILPSNIPRVCLRWLNLLL